MLHMSCYVTMYCQVAVWHAVVMSSWLGEARKLAVYSEMLVNPWRCLCSFVEMYTEIDWVEAHCYVVDIGEFVVIEHIHCISY